MMMGGKGDPIVVWADHDYFAEKIISKAYADGLCANNQYLTQSEASLITSLDSHDGNALNVLGTNDFSYFQYFTNAELISTYSIQSNGHSQYKNSLIILSPNTVNNWIPGVRRFAYCRIVLLSSTPRPLFNAGSAPYRASATRFYECRYAKIYVPDGSVEAWQPYVDCAAECPSWMSNNDITLHAISELSALELSKIKIPY